MSVFKHLPKKKKNQNALKVFFFFFNKKELYTYPKFVSQIKREALSCPSELLCGVYPRHMCVKLTSPDKMETPRARYSQLSLLGLLATSVMLPVSRDGGAGLLYRDKGQNIYPLRPSHKLNRKDAG